MNLALEISSGNAAFDDGNSGRTETARILRELAQKIEDGSNATKVYDLNGNVVGKLNLNDEE